MSNDLERFLQQAAERLAQKASGRAQGPGASSLPSQNKQRSLPPTAEVVSATVVDPAQNRARTLREAGPDPLSTIDTRPELAQQISQTDERMVSHVHQVFDHELTQLKAASASLAGAPKLTAEDLENKQVPLVNLLRNPHTLKAAYIASEIFKRKA